MTRKCPQAEKWGPGGCCPLQQWLEPKAGAKSICYKVFGKKCVLVTMQCLGLYSQQYCVAHLKFTKRVNLVLTTRKKSNYLKR